MYANPAAYFLQGLGVNEFESENWSTPVEGDPSMTVGELYLVQRWVHGMACFHGVCAWVPSL